MDLKRTVFSYIGFSILLCGSGCSDTDEIRLPVFPVKGQISFNGKPAAGAFVVLHPKGNADPRLVPPRAIVDADGSFELSTYESQDGAAAGEYSLTVEWRKLVKEGGDFKAGPNVLPARYSKPATSKLEVRVAEGFNQLEPIQLRR